MNNNFGQFLALCLASILAISCKKNSGLNNAVTTKYITKYVSFSPSWPVGMDTVWVYDFSYDANKRLTKIVSRYFSSSGVLSFTETQERFYQGTDTLPFKHEIQILSTVTGDNRYSHLLYYNANGIIIKDSITHYYNPPLPDQYSFALYYTSSGNNITRLNKFNRPSIGYITTDSTFTVENIINGNLMSRTDTITYYPPMPLSIEVKTKYYEASYDTKRNPLRPLLLNYPLYFCGLSSTSSSGGFNRSVNNPTYVTSESSSPININYTYNAAGYPDSSISYSLTGTPIRKAKYIYTSF